MNYANQIEHIKSLLPNLDIVGEDELSLFENEAFAKMCQDFFVSEAKLLENRIDLKILFAFRNQQTFNASAIKYQRENIILINVGLINKIEKLVDKSVTYFCENINTIITGFNIPKERLFKFYKSLVISYIFYHEIGHLLQINYSDESGNYSMKEEYDYKQTFNIKNHIYELDSDHFGICIASAMLLDYFMDNKIVEQMLIMNLTALFLFLISNVFLEFSNFSEEIYYKEFSHPHPAIRIIECREQILNMINNNIQVDKSLLLFSLKRTEILIDWFLQENGFQFKFSEMINERFSEVEKYGKEIEDLNESYDELIRHRSQKIFNSIRT